MLTPESRPTAHGCHDLRAWPDGWPSRASVCLRLVRCQISNCQRYGALQPRWSEQVRRDKATLCSRVGSLVTRVPQDLTNRAVQRSAAGGSDSGSAWAEAGATARAQGVLVLWPCLTFVSC